MLASSDAAVPVSSSRNITTRHGSPGKGEAWRVGRSDHEMNQILGGAVAGLAGTGVMSAAMAIAKAVGLLAGEPPPRTVSRNLEEVVGVYDDLPGPAFEASWVGQHFAYGSTAGMVYALTRDRLKLADPLPAGPLFGVALWAFGYVGWLPATGLYPPPTAEPKRRVATLIAAHLIYGTATAAVLRVLSPADHKSLYRRPSLPNRTHSKANAERRVESHIVYQP
jgi:hypothetical protein